MGAQRTYHKRFERQAGQRLERSLGEVTEASLPNDFMDLLRRADERRKQAGGSRNNGEPEPA